MEQFIPEKDSELYKNYTVKVFRMVPKNAMLIRQNIFTGAVSVKKSGFRFSFPWQRSKLVNITRTVIDYPKEEYKTLDDIYVQIDPALTVSIVEPDKFEFCNHNPIEELGVLVKDVIRSFVVSAKADSLIGNNYSLDEIDFDEKFKEFEENAGLHVHSLSFKNIILPKNLLDDYEKRKTQELENRRAEAEAESKKKQAQINAEAQKYKADADAYTEKAKLQAIIDLLKERGYNPDVISQIVSASLVHGSNANVIANLGINSTNNQEAAAAMILSALGNGPKSGSNGRMRIIARRKRPGSPSSDISCQNNGN